MDDWVVVTDLDSIRVRVIDFGCVGLQILDSADESVRVWVTDFGFGTIHRSEKKLFFELRFVASDGSDQDARYALSKLLQRGTVAEYESEFLMLIKRVTGISESLLKSFYISGLKPTLQCALLTSNPTTLSEAFSLARATEACFAKDALSKLLQRGTARFEAIAHEEKATAEKEQSIKETTNTITSLQSDVASLKAKGSLDANEEIKKDHTLVHDLEKQVEKLPMELQLKNNFREALETTSKVLEKTMLDLNPTLHDLQNVAVDQKKKHYKTKHALNIIDEEFKEEFKEAKSEATTKIRNLAKVYGAWLPPWLATRLVVYHPYVKNESKEFLYIQGRI
ncbi:hypothetical protein Tco_0934432, partial [Tanacetum coccineum]